MYCARLIKCCSNACWKHDLLQQPLAPLTAAKFLHGTPTLSGYRMMLHDLGVHTIQRPPCPQCSFAAIQDIYLMQTFFELSYCSNFLNLLFVGGISTLTLVSTTVLTGNVLSYYMPLFSK